MTWEQTIPAAIGVSGFLWAYIGFNLDKDSHGPIRLLLILVGLSHTLLLFPFLNLIIDHNLTGGLEANFITLATSGMSLTIYPYLIVITWLMVFIIGRTVLGIMAFRRKSPPKRL